MNAQQTAVALFKFLESQGFHPSTRCIGRMLRDPSLKIKCTDSELRKWLEKFSGESRKKSTNFHDAAATQTDSITTQKISTNDALPTQFDATPPQLRARNKVSLVSNKLPTVTGEPEQERLFESASPETTAKKAVKAKREPKAPSPPRPEHLILDAVGACVAPHLSKITITQWRRNSAHVARDMAEAGVTPEEAASAWRDEYDRTGIPMLVLKWLQERMASQAVSRGPRRAVEIGPYSNEHLKSYSQELAELERDGDPRADELRAQLDEADRIGLAQRAAMGFVPVPVTVYA